MSGNAGVFLKTKAPPKIFKYASGSPWLYRNQLRDVSVQPYKIQGTESYHFLKKLWLINMAALRCIVNIEPNNPTWCGSERLRAFAASTDTLTLSTETQRPSCAWGLRRVEMTNRWVPTLACTWVLLGNFRWIQRSLESEPWQDGMLKLQGKKQTNLTPTLRDGSDNHEMKKKKPTTKKRKLLTVC